MVLSMEFDKDTLLECFLHHLNLADEIIFPLDYYLFIVDNFRILHSVISANKFQKWSTIMLDGIKLICFVKPWLTLGVFLYQKHFLIQIYFGFIKPCFILVLFVFLIPYLLILFIILSNVELKIYQVLCHRSTNKINKCMLWSLPTMWSISCTMVWSCCWSHWIKAGYSRPMNINFQACNKKVNYVA